MIKRCRLAAAVMLGTAAFSWSVHAAPVPDVGIPSILKTSPAVATAAQITDPINAEIARLAKDDDPATQSLARDWLVAESSVSANGGDVSAAYAELYTTTVAQGLSDLLKKPGLSARARVDAGIIAYEVTRRTKSPDLRVVIQSLLDDKSDAVVMWGIKAGQVALLPVYVSLALQPDEKKGLLDAMVKAATTHDSGPLSGAIVENTYRALNPQLNDFLKDPPAELPRLLIAADLAVIKHRLDQYKSGLPDNPHADSIGVILILTTSYWKSDAMDDKAKLASMQSACDLLSLTAQRLVGTGNVDDESFRSIQDTAKELGYLNQTEWNDPAIDGALIPLKSLQVGTPRKFVLESVQPLPGYFQKASPVLKDLQPAPTVNPVAK